MQPWCFSRLQDVSPELPLALGILEPKLGFLDEHVSEVNGCTIPLPQVGLRLDSGWFNTFAIGVDC